MGKEQVPSSSENQEKIHDPEIAEAAAYAEKPYRDQRRLFGLRGPSQENIERGARAAERVVQRNEEKFYPGKSSNAGFLALNEKLDVVIARDQAICERYEVTPRQIGEAIEEILQGKREDEFEVSMNTYRGMQDCPFGCEHQYFSNADFTITNKKTGESFEGPGLIAHLLKQHDFFEGNTPYRVDPQGAIKVLFEKSAHEK